MGADTFGTHYSEFEIELNHSDGPTQDKILDQIENLTQNNNYVGLNFAINTFLTERIEETISGYYSSVVINIIGTNLDAIDQDTQKISSSLASVKGVKNINIVSPAGTPQITIHFLSEKLSQGVS